MDTMIQLVLEATQETVVMVFLSTVFSLILGFPIGVLLHVTGAEAVAHLRSRRFGQAMRGNAGQDLAGVVDDSVAAHSQAPLR